MGRGIRLSEKHGVNPSVGVCYYCGEERPMKSRVLVTTTDQRVKMVAHNLIEAAERLRLGRAKQDNTAVHVVDEMRKELDLYGGVHSPSGRVTCIMAAMLAEQANHFANTRYTDSRRDIETITFNELTRTIIAEAK